MPVSYHPNGVSPLFHVRPLSVAHAYLPFLGAMFLRLDWDRGKTARECLVSNRALFAADLNPMIDGVCRLDQHGCRGTEKLATTE